MALTLNYNYFIHAVAGTPFSFLLIMPFSFNMQTLANPRAPVLTPRAPLTPSFSLIKNTVTTNVFKGIPNRFKITLRCESGTYFERRVPIDGKYIPTHASKRKKEIDNADKTIVGEKEAKEVVEKAADPIARVARRSIPAENFSSWTDILFTSWLKVVDPRRQHAMKQEKIVP